MPNPFFYGGRITEPERFVGRKAELGRIFAALETAHTGQLQSISVVGPRRIGRSSLLYHLTQVYRQHLSRPDDYAFAYVDLQDARCQTLPGLLGTILEQLGQTPRLVVSHAAQRSGVAADGTPLRSVPDYQQQEGQSITLVEFEQTIRELSGPTGLHRWPVVCLDEFEQLTKDPQEFPDALYDCWRSLMNASRIAFVTASQSPLDKLSRRGKLTSPFFNVFMYLALEEFTPEEARALVDRGRTCDRPFTDEECRRVLKLAGRHPYCLQVAGSLVYQAKAGGRSVDWPAVERDYRRQVAPVLAEVPWWQRLLHWLDLGLQHIGRLVLLLPPFKPEVTDPAIIRSVGLLVVIIVLLLIFGFIGPETLWNWAKLLLGGK